MTGDTRSFSESGILKKHPVHGTFFTVSGLDRTKKSVRLAMLFGCGFPEGPSGLDGHRPMIWNHEGLLDPKRRSCPLPPTPDFRTRREAISAKPRPLIFAPDDVV